MNRIRRVKDRFYTQIDENISYENVLRKVRKEAKKMKHGQLEQKYSKTIIQEALNGRGTSETERDFVMRTGRY